MKKLIEIEVLKDAAILRSNGEREFFNAIYLDSTGIFFGKINTLEEFIETGFIPKQNIVKVLEGKKTQALKKVP